jgi:hypothetical protein
VQSLVIFIFVDAVERDLNDCGDDVGNFIANGEIEIAVHYAPFFIVARGQRKDPCVTVGVISPPVSGGT